MPHKKKKHSKQNQVNVIPKSVQVGLIATDVVPTSLKVGLIATTACAITAPVLTKQLLEECSKVYCDVHSALGCVGVGVVTFVASPFVGVLAAGVSELSMFTKKKIVEKYYKDFRNLPVEQQVVLGIAAYNILVGTAVGGSFFVIANATAREYLFDAALHFLNAYALNSESKLINAIALGGNIARMAQIDSVLNAGTSTIPKALNIIDGFVNHPSTILGLGTKWFSKSVPPAQPIIQNVQHTSTHRNTM